MEIVITAVGPDNVGLADPIIHDIAARGGNFAEIQMYDHDEAAVFAMMCRLQIDASHYESIRATMAEIGKAKKLEVRVWSPDLRTASPGSRSAQPFWKMYHERCLQLYEVVRFKLTQRSCWVIDPSANRWQKNLACHGKWSAMKMDLRMTFAWSKY